MHFFYNSKCTQTTLNKLLNCSDLIPMACPSHLTLSKALNKSKNTSLASTGGLHSKDELMSGTIESSWYSQESEGRKPD